jgi:hypothetical protein
MNDTCEDNGNEKSEKVQWRRNNKLVERRTWEVYNGPTTHGLKMLRTRKHDGLNGGWKHQSFFLNGKFKRQ